MLDLRVLWGLSIDKIIFILYKLFCIFYPIPWTYPSQKPWVYQENTHRRTVCTVYTLHRHLGSVRSF